MYHNYVNYKVIFKIVFLNIILYYNYNYNDFSYLLFFMNKYIIILKVVFIYTLLMTYRNS